VFLDSFVLAYPHISSMTPLTAEFQLAFHLNPEPPYFSKMICHHLVHLMHRIGAYYRACLFLINFPNTSPTCVCLVL